MQFEFRSFISPRKRSDLSRSAQTLFSDARIAARRYYGLDPHLSLALEHVASVASDLRLVSSPNMDGFVPTLEWKAAWLDFARPCRDRLVRAIASSPFETDCAQRALRSMDAHVAEVIELNTPSTT